MLKRLTITVLALTSLSSFAKSSVQFSRTSSASGQAAYEVVLKGDVARKIYSNLNSEVKNVGGWKNKAANGIICGVHTRLGYSCSLVADEQGVQH